MPLQLARTIPAVLWMLTIFIMSSQGQIPQAPGISSQLLAIAGHLVAYAILALFIAWAIAPHVGRALHRLMLAWGLAFLYGVSDEIHQSFVPGRYATVDDALINAVGAAAGLTMMYAISRRHRERATT